jgi:hypothetical protein
MSPPDRANSVKGQLVNMWTKTSFKTIELNHSTSLKEAFCHYQSVVTITAKSAFKSFSICRKVKIESVQFNLKQLFINFHGNKKNMRQLHQGTRRRNGIAPCRPRGMGDEKQLCSFREYLAVLLRAVPQRLL